MINSKVKLIMADGTKQRIELLNRPPVLTINLHFKHGEIIENVHFIRTGPDEYRQKIFEREDAIDGQIIYGSTK